MKLNFFKAIVLAVVLVLVSCSKVPHSGEMTFKSQTDSVSYALGFLMAKNVKQSAAGPFDTLDYKTLAKAYIGHLKPEMLERYKQSFDTLDIDAYYKGFFNELGYGKSYFEDSFADGYLRTVYQGLKTKKEEEKAAMSAVNIEKGNAFLESNKLREEIVTTESGLQYEVVKLGTGDMPSLKDKVKCIYHGTLLDGTVFDSSKERQDTASFAVTGVIKGWTEALQLMPVGSIYKLYIPSELAYGQRGAGAKIGANETLIFEIELVDIVK